MTQQIYIFFNFQQLKPLKEVLKTVEKSIFKSLNHRRKLSQKTN